MKRVIDGSTYNVLTSSLVAKYEYEDDKGYDNEAKLYQTRGGAFFIVHSWQVDERDKYHFETISRSEIARLVERTDGLEIVDSSILSDPPEAEASEEPGATIYLRVPVALKKRVDDAARAAGLSGNAWAMRCVERCLAPAG